MKELAFVYHILVCLIEIRALQIQCFSCDDLMRTTDCNVIATCDPDQICYTEKIFVNKEARYRMGCTRKDTCISQPTSAAVVGKRNVNYPGLPSIHYCADCCSTPYCNRNACTNVNTMHLINPPPQIICEDYDSNACSALYVPNICNDASMRNFFCRRTCGYCGGKKYVPGIHQQVQSPTKMSTTSIPTKISTSDPCHDDGVDCEDPEIKKLICKIDPSQCKKSCGLCRKQYIPGHNHQGSSIQSPKNIPSTSIPPTTSTSDSCHDDGVNCVDPVIKQLVCRVDPGQCKKSCGLCGGSTKEMSSATQASVTSIPSTNPDHPVCSDPITECQCKFLDREIDLCNDTDHTGNSFCCYYCKRKLHPRRYRCPDPFCKRVEKPEIDRVQGMNITCHDKQTH